MIKLIVLNSKIKERILPLLQARKIYANSIRVFRNHTFGQMFLKISQTPQETHVLE